MAYDLHGIWDSDNPIGSQVLAHTNLTEIDHALDLLWRNDVDPKKVNLGIGFYGRTYQLADPGCNTPGCLFKGGGTKGPCTDQSGILSYAEIMDIKDKYDLSPVYDQEHGVKYLTFEGDQWVSYDDLDTIQQKVEFANSKGLGGLLIWALDLDTPQLDALSAVIWPETLGFRAGDKGADNWEDIGEGFCYSTDCGVNHCKTGYVKMQDFWCGDNNYPFNNPDGKQSLCCPIASAPDIDEWYVPHSSDMQC
jgi:chitinase